MIFFFIQSNIILGFSLQEEEIKMGFLKPKITWPISLTLCSSKALSFSQCFAERPNPSLSLSSSRRYKP
jgi:hypothetical protein